MGTRLSLAWRCHSAIDSTEGRKIRSGLADGSSGQLQMTWSWEGWGVDRDARLVCTSRRIGKKREIKNSWTRRRWIVEEKRGRSGEESSQIVHKQNGRKGWRWRSDRKIAWNGSVVVGYSAEWTREQVISLFLLLSLLSLSLASDKSTREESDPWLLLARLKR